MNNKIRLIHLLAASCILFLSAMESMAGGRMSVQIRTAQLRATPSYLGAVEAQLDYGDRVAILESQRAWRRVAHPDGRAGWLHESALTSKRVVLAAADDATVTAASHEVALAGKGFNQQVEDEFKNRHTAIDFSWVDRMETMAIPHEQIQRFLATAAGESEQ